MVAICELYDKSGRLRIDIATMTCKILGQAVVGLSAGSVTHLGFSRGNPWFYLSPLGSDTRTFLPVVQTSGSGGSYQISWDARSSGQSAMLIYGIY